MKNTSSLFLTLVSYLIMLATIMFLLFAIMPSSLKAQTSAEMVATNAAVTNTVASASVEKPQTAPAPSINIDGTGVHIGGASSGDKQVPFVATLSATLALLIPIIAIVMGCSIPMVIVGLVFYFRHRKNQMLHETVRAMVEKGVPIPPEMFQKSEHEFMEHDRAKRPRSDFRNGLIFIGVGIGILIVAGKTGWIILFMGVAFLVASLFEKKNDQQPPKF
jgi:hypothetical protein